MKVKGYEIEVTDFWDKDDEGFEIYTEVSKEAVAHYFEKEKVKIVDNNGKENKNYVSGEIQFMFDSDWDLEEVLLFPVYKDGDGFSVGEDYVSLNDPEFFDDDLIEMLKQSLEDECDEEIRFRIVASGFTEIEKILDEAGYDYDYDSGDRMMVNQAGLDVLYKAGADFDEV